VVGLLLVAGANEHPREYSMNDLVQFDHDQDGYSKSSHQLLESRSIQWEIELLSEKAEDINLSYIRDIGTLQLKWTFEEEVNQDFCAVDFSPDGRMVASASGSGHVDLLDCGTGKRIRSFSRNGGFTSVAYSPDDRFVVAGTLGNSIFVYWVVSTMTRYILFRNSMATRILFSMYRGPKVVIKY